MKKVYTKYIEDYDVFFYSVIEDSQFENFKNLVEAYFKIGFTLNVGICWQGGCFRFQNADYLKVINNALEATGEELKTLSKFGIRGVDFFEQLLDHLKEALYTWKYEDNKVIFFLRKIPKEDLDYVRPFYLKLFENDLNPKLKSLLDEN